MTPAIDISYACASEAILSTRAYVAEFLLERIASASSSFTSVILLRALAIFIEAGPFLFIATPLFFTLNDLVILSPLLVLSPPLVPFPLSVFSSLPPLLFMKLNEFKSPRCCFEFWGITGEGMKLGGFRERRPTLKYVVMLYIFRTSIAPFRR